MRALWMLIALVACEGVDDEPAAFDSAIDTGAPVLEARAMGGQAPGLVNTTRQPLSTFPLDGSLVYEGIVPAEPLDRPFAVQTQLTHGKVWQLDVGIRAGALALDAENVGVQLAFNPQAVRRYQLRGATGTGFGIEPERILTVPPGSVRGATFDLLPAPRDAAGRAPSRFLGTVTLSWTEDGVEQEERVVLEAP
jgi:hypothetical protein